MSRITNVKGTQDKHIPIFSQLNFTHRWLSVVVIIDFEELHNADKSIVEHCGIYINLSVFISQ